MSLKRKISAFILLLVLIGPAAFTYTYLKYQKKQVKRTLKWRMIAATDKAELVHFAFTSEEISNDLRWEHSKEFEYRGQMYDVVESEVIGDTTYFTCWWDHEETALNKKLSGFVTLAWGHNDHKKEKEGKLINYFKSLFWEDAVTIAFRNVENDLLRNNFISEITSGHSMALDKVPKA